MVDKKIRNSSFELLRIISMVLIVLCHILGHGKVLNNSNGILYHILLFVEITCMVHVNSYVLVTGYFQSKTKFNIKKIINLMLSSWFYRVCFCIFFVTFGIVSLSKISIIKNFFFFTDTTYWFITAYIILYMISPFLNKLINSLSKRQYTLLLIIIFTLCSCFATLHGYNRFGNLKGYSIVNFIFLYLLGAYINKYPVDQSNFKIFSNRKAMIIILFSSLIFFISLNFLIHNYGLVLQEFPGGIRSIGNNITKVTLNYDNPLIILSGFSYFLLFYYFKFESKVINFISRNTIDIYMIHEYPLVRQNIYSLLGFTLASYTSYMTIIHVLICTIIIFISSYLLSLVKTLIFKIFGKLKLFKQLNTKLDNYNKKFNNILE